jgi:uncharacterized protein with HEPN domain
MRSEEQDLAYLWDMREASREIVAFVKGVKYAGFIQNRMIRYAVERQLQVIGLRNVLAHEYGEIQVDRIWNAATVSVPELLEALQPLVSEE